MAATVAIIGVVIFVAHFLVLLFQKTRIPDVLMLMLGGIIAGPISNDVPASSVKSKPDPHSMD